MKNDITKDDLIKKGYKNYANWGVGNHDSEYQIKVKSKEGQSVYYINFHYFDFSKMEGISWDEAFTANAQFMMNNGDTVDITHHVGKCSVEEIEGFFSEFYEKFNCVPHC